MALRFNDRVKQLVTTPPGTGAFTFASTPTGFIAFSAIGSIANNDIVPYSAWDGASKWEVGYGTWNSGAGTLTRTTVKASSAGGSAENFTGNVTVWCDAPASGIPLLNAAGNLDMGAGNIVTTGTLGAGAATLSSVLVGNANLTSAWLRFTSGGLVGEFNCGQILADSGGMSLFVRAGGGGGVQLLAGATSWSAVSQRGKKRDFRPIEDPLAILERLRGAYGLYNYKTDDKDAKVRAGVMYEETAEAFPPAAFYAAASKEQNLPEHKGVSLEVYVPLLLAICETLAAKVKVLEANAKG